MFDQSPLVPASELRGHSYPELISYSDIEFSSDGDCLYGNYRINERTFTACIRIPIPIERHITLKEKGYHHLIYRRILDEYQKYLMRESQKKYESIPTFGAINISSQSQEWKMIKNSIQSGLSINCRVISSFRVIINGWEKIYFDGDMEKFYDAAGEFFWNHHVDSKFFIIPSHFLEIVDKPKNK